MIYRFRVVLDSIAEEDVFRDLEIRETDTMEDLHNIITQSFGFDGMEMASFYVSDSEWNQGEEIAMLDLGDTRDPIKTMNTTVINDLVHEAATRLIYVYDFLNMWTFYVELAEIVEEAPSTDYPNLIYVQGQVPDEAPEKIFEAEEDEDEDAFNEFEDNEDLEGYDDIDYDQYWN